MRHVNPEMEVLRPCITNKVKMASAQYSDLPEYEEKVTEHVNILLNLFEIMLSAKPL